ncbi:tether containing UBX domain for GLUT4 [Lissotriton helveticus]
MTLQITFLTQCSVPGYFTGTFSCKQVLEETCRKQNFNPDEFDLKFQRLVLDLSLQWRFANLPNNAKLEMVPASRLRAGPTNTVRIALQLEDGSRLQEEFLSSQSLWDVLHHFPQSRQCMEELCHEFLPVCVYMRDEVTGEDALKDTSLKSLGLTAGSGNIRFFIKKTSLLSAEGDLGSPQTNTTSAKSDHGRLQASTPSAQGDPGRPLACMITPSAQGGPRRMQDTTISTSAQRESSGPQPVPSGSSAQRGPAGGVEDTAESIVGAGRTGPATKSLVSQPYSDSFLIQRGDQNNASSEDQVTKASAEFNTVDDELPSQKKIQPSHLLEAAPPTPFIPFLGGGQRLGSASGESLSSAKGVPVPVNLPSSQSSPGGPSKPKKIKSLSEQEGGYLLVEREAVVCHLDLEDPERKEWLVSSSEDLPDEFFEVTVDDVRKRMAQLKSERQRLTEMPLMTNALREAQKMEKLERYPKVVLRVLFPDRFILQGFFHPEETIRALKDFVKSHLEDSSVPFYLFITPPRTLLNDESETFFQANLFPAAVVHFGSEVVRDHYLKQHQLDSIVSPSLADLLVARSMPRSHITETPSNREVSTVEEVAPLVVSSVAQDSTVSQAPPTAKSDPAKVPKWLKLPGKK